MLLLKPLDTGTAHAVMMHACMLLHQMHLQGLLSSLAHSTWYRFLAQTLEGLKPVATCGNTYC